MVFIVCIVIVVFVNKMSELKIVIFIKENKDYLKQDEDSSNKFCYI